MLNEKVCPAGMHCPPGMERVPELVRDRCWIGHYCTNGSVNAYPIQCPIGTFNDKFGLKQVSECQQCTPGTKRVMSV